MNKLLKYTLLFAVVAAASEPTMAAANVFTNVSSRMVNAFEGIKLIVFIVGAFCLIGAGAMAMFGKLKWSWFWMLALGLVVIAVAGQIVDWVAMDKNTGAGLQTDLGTYDSWGTKTDGGS